MAELKKGGRPRGRKTQLKAKPIASGQLTDEESEILSALSFRTGQSRSELTRRAVVLMLLADTRGEVDFGKAVSLNGD